MDRRLDQEIEAFFEAEKPDRLGVAVSGGSDSLALLLLLDHFSKNLDIELACVTVDHGLRPEAAGEARFVSNVCAGLGVSHSTLKWSGWDGTGNVQNEARGARYALIAQWANEQHISQVALGHTLDDQAETVLLRLARAAGVDGLSAMAPRRDQNGVTWLRPLLQFERKALRAYLKENQTSWIEDPSNQDTRFDRIRVRQSWDALESLGVTPTGLAQVAANMARARAALDVATREACRNCVTLRAGAVQISMPDFRALPDEIARRLILAALAWVGGAVYAPRRRSLDAALAALTSEGSATLDGCHMRTADDHLWVFREFRAIQDVSVPVGDLWDGCWRVSGTGNTDGMQVAALGGKGLAEVPEWRALGVPREVLMSTPSVWKEDVLVATPVIVPDKAWNVDRKKRNLSIFDAVFAH